MQRVCRVLSAVSGATCAAFLLLWLVSYALRLELMVELGDSEHTRSFRVEWGTLRDTERSLGLCVPPPHTGFAVRLISAPVPDNVRPDLGLACFESGGRGGCGPSWFYKSIPIWLPALLSAAVYSGSRRLVRWSTIVPGLCATCGYDLRATPGKCPECGAEVEADSTDR